MICDGVLKEVGTTHRVENLAEARGAVEINAAGRVVMPGFIDCHTHLAFPAPDVEDEQRGAAIRAIAADTGKRTSARWMAYLAAMARHGITTVEAKTGAAPDSDAERKLLRVLSMVRHQVVDVAPTILLRVPSRDVMTEPEREDYWHWLCREFLPRARRANLAHFVDVAWDDDPASQICLEVFLKCARAAGLPCKVHAHGRKPGHAMALGVRHLAVSVDHMEEATALQALTLAGSPTMATLLPLTAFYRRASNPPARAFVRAGVAIALGSDFNPHHSPTFNMQTVIALACHRLELTPEEAISAATINGAHALGCAAGKGSLEPGKDADLLVLNLSDYRDLASQFGANMVHLTMKRGEVIYREGAILPPRGQAALPDHELVLQ